MIINFADRETQRIFHGDSSHRLPPEIQHVARRKLWMLHAAVDIRDLKAPPANRLERLRGDREGQWSVRINRQWRLCFIWQRGHAFSVEIVDYH